VRKIRSHAALVRAGRKPTWINDTANQAKWSGQLIGILKRDYRNTDSTISAILNNEKLAEMCAVKIRSYVDKGITDWLYRERRDRGANFRRQLEIAIAGLHVAIGLYADQGNEVVAAYLREREIELSAQLERCKAAFATKRHGRDRAHSTLSECHSFLETHLGKHVTNATLANLVSAGYEADGNISKEPITEEHIRKNLATFRRNNPLWRNHLDPSLKLPPDPETK
jgi:hypothetical protein